MSRLVNVGNVVIDIVMYVPELPARGGDMIASASQVVPGGGMNVMISAVRQGLPTAYGGMHGTGPFGDLARREMRAAGIEILQPVHPTKDTGFDVALVEDSSERTFATSVGADGELGAGELARIAVLPTDFVYVSGYGLVHEVNGPALADWLDTVEGATVVFDPGPLVADIPAPILDAVLARTDWFSGNQREAGLLTGSTDPFGAARALATRIDAGVLVRTGPHGCVLATSRCAPEEIGGFAVTAVDTNGAGDAHVGAFIAGLAVGLTAGAAALRANAAAALAVTKRGPTTAPGQIEVDLLLAAG
jgi:sugar/nucleoside kinase (ribokinase family)